MLYLPDTSTIIAWARWGNASVTDKMKQHRGAIGLSAIVAYELYFGAMKSAQVDRNLRTLESFGLPTLDFERDDAKAAGTIRAALERAGTPIGPYYLLIAGQATARGATVVTNNTREFSRVDGLAVEDWTV